MRAPPSPRARALFAPALHAPAGDRARPAPPAALVQAESPHLLVLLEHKLQEAHVAGARAELLQLLPAYTGCHWAVSTEKKGYSGVVALTRPVDGLPPPTVSLGLGDGDADHEWATEGRVLTLRYGDRLSVVCLYTPNSGGAHTARPPPPPPPPPTGLRPAPLQRG